MRNGEEDWTGGNCKVDSAIGNTWNYFQYLDLCVCEKSLSGWTWIATTVLSFRHEVFKQANHFMSFTHSESIRGCNINRREILCAF